MIAEIKKCGFCGKHFRGRSNKKFCSDTCRYGYSNKKYAAYNRKTQTRSIINALLRNRFILEELISEKKDSGKVAREQMLTVGFNFKYITHIHTTTANRRFYCCFEYSYFPLENDVYLIIRRKE